MPSNMPRINRVEIQGFRAFGKDLQTIDIPSCIAVLWGPNSQGKTSLAEAIEFLLTGDIVRRELLASAQDEFADSLRNAHMPADVPVFVLAEIVGTDDQPRRIKRTLVSDYGKKASCTSTLEIDGVRADQTALAKLGIVLSQPPIAAPVLMQHTLGYLFSAKPQERSTYFKALLEVADLDTLRAKIAESEPFLNRAEAPIIGKLRRCAGQPVLKPILEPLLEAGGNAPQVAKALTAAATALLTAAGATVPETDAERLKAIEDLLAEKRARTFPLNYFDLKPLRPWDPPKDQSWRDLDNFIVQASKLAAETKRLTALFTEVMKIPGIPETRDPITCPVCETPAALTPARIHKIREQLKASEDYRNAQAAAQNALRQIDTTLSNVKQSIAVSSPQLFQLSGGKRKTAGFSDERMRALLQPDQLPLVETWKAALISLAKERRLLRPVILRAATATKGFLADLDKLSESKLLKDAVELTASRHTAFKTALDGYTKAEQPLRQALHAAIDAQSKTVGWQDFLEIGGKENDLRAELISLQAGEALKKEFAKALREIDKAKEQVLNDKFTGLSNEIQDWWERLRPEESSFFSGVKPRAQAQRTIDFKASLSSDTNRQTVQIREAVAVFSYSQIHCLGLAAFLARAMRERSGFIVLDDPILSSDDDHRVHFLHEGIQTLLDAGFQIILLTQDQGIRRDLGELYAHKNIDCFEIEMHDPARGTEVNKTSDSLLAMLTRAKPYLRSIDKDIRKQAAERLRDAAERFCKEVIVDNARKSGAPQACLTDCDGKNLGRLIPDVEPYLKDPSHSGKLRAMARNLNPGNHDDDVPDKGTLVHAYGDLEKFRKDYGL